tara:strand:+ start:88 stop:750 length:663 start_codon:yes stop_codon:yes gene_type:complete
MNNEFGLLALNQTLFNKAFIIGKGFEEGKQSYADETINDGWYVFVNGKTIIPEEHGDIKELYTIGTMYYDDLLVGMPSCGGQVRYSLAITNDEYLIIVGVKIDNDEDEETDFIEDIAVFMWINRMPSPMFRKGELTIQKLAKELLMSHFLVFMGSNNAREIYNRIEIDRTEENSVLIEVIEEFIELTESNKISKQTISKEEKEIIEKMNDLSDENIVLPD